METLKGIKTVQQIANEFDVHPVQVSEWEKKLCDQAGSVFDPGRPTAQRPEFAEERSALHSKNGELTVQVGTCG